MSISIPTVSLRGGEVSPQGPNVTSTGINTPNVTGARNVAKTLPLFRDLGKPVNDLLTKSFPSSYKLEVITAAQNGLKFTFAAERRRHPQDATFVSSQARYEVNPRLTLVGTIDSEKLEGEVTVNNLGIDGLKTTFKGKFLDNNRSEASVEGAYATSSLSGAVGLFVKDDRSRVEGQVATQVYENLTVGALASYFLPSGTQEGSTDNYQIGTNYVTGKLDSTNYVKFSAVKGQSNLNTTVGARVFYRHDVTRNTNFGADVSYVLGTSFNTVELKLAGEGKFDDNTTLRVAVERSGKLRLALANKINSNITATIGAELSALRPEEFNVTGTLSFQG